MKRWKIVLPALLATSGLPLVSLVGCGDKEIEGQRIDFNNKIEDSEGGFRILCEPFALEKDKVYTAVVNLSQIEFTQECSVLSFGHFEPMNALDDDISIKKIIINDKHLDQTTFEEKEKGGWFFHSDGEVTTLFMVSTKGSQFNMKGNVYITFTAKNTTEPLYWQFGNVS